MDGEQEQTPANPEVTKTSKAAEELADATKAAERAQARADKAKAAADAAAAEAKAAQEKADEASKAAIDPETLKPLNCLVIDDGLGSLSVHPVPEGWFFERRMHFQGQNFEHVSDDAHGRWIYRQM